LARQLLLNSFFHSAVHHGGFDGQEDGMPLSQGGGSIATGVLYIIFTVGSAVGVHLPVQPEITVEADICESEIA
jgi:hypothetical protein